MAGFEVVVRVARLALESSSEGVESLERSVARTAAAYTRLAGAVIGTLVAGAVLGAAADLVGTQPRRPPRLILLLGGFFVLTVGGVGVRGATALLGGDVVTGLHNLADFALQVPTVALAIAAGVMIGERWRRRGRAEDVPAPG